MTANDHSIGGCITVNKTAKHPAFPGLKFSWVKIGNTDVSNDTYVIRVVNAMEKIKQKRKASLRGHLVEREEACGHLKTEYSR